MFEQFCIENNIAEIGYSRVDYTTKAGTMLSHAVTVVLKLSDAVVDEIQGAPTFSYFHHYRTLNAAIDRIILSMSQWFELEGYKTMPVPASQTISDDHSAMFSHKKAAVLAGLGYIGKSALFISHKYGARVRLGTLLTDKAFDVPDFDYKDGCGDCDLCVKACPAMAISGRVYNPSMKREDFYDARACSNYMKDKFQHIGRGAVCGLCIACCPKAT